MDNYKTSKELDNALIIGLTILLGVGSIIGAIVTMVLAFRYPLLWLPVGSMGAWKLFEALKGVVNHLDDNESVPTEKENHEEAIHNSSAASN